MMRRLVERMCSWYVSTFGTSVMFAVSLVLLIVWVGLIPVMGGFWQWNATVGLLGNDVESTGEWFFGIATLVVAAEINRKQGGQQDRMAEQVRLLTEGRDHDTKLLRRIASLEARIEKRDELILAELQRLAGGTHAQTASPPTRAVPKRSGTSAS